MFRNSLKRKLSGILINLAIEALHLETKGITMRSIEQRQTQFTQIALIH